MSLRIRYIPSDNGLLKTKRTLVHPTNGAQYIVELDKAALSWKVLDATTKAEAASGKAISLNQVKINARKHLETLGIVLDRETRNVQERRPSQS